MKDYQTQNIRNIAIVGHGGEGKTTLTEALLWTTGAIDRMGRVEDGNTVSDYDTEEIRRQFSISTSVAPVEWKDKKINFIDIPGYFDFIGEMMGPLRIVDAALIVVGAVNGLNVGAEKAMAYTSKHSIPRAIFINSMDRENADYDKVIQQLGEKYQTAICPVMLPIYEDDTFIGFSSLVTGKSYRYLDKFSKEVETTPEMRERIEAVWEQVTEAAASADDELMEKYFETGELTDEEKFRGLRKGIAAATITPVFCGAALPALGIDNLLNFIVTLMPSPDEKAFPKRGTNPKTIEPAERVCSVDEPFSAQVFKTLADPFVGKISLIKVISGVLTPNTQFSNANREKLAKAGSVSIMCGKKLTPTFKLIAGDIGVLTKLVDTKTGDTLCDPVHPIVFPWVTYPEPCYSMAIQAKKKGEEDKIMQGLQRLAEEDPSFRIEKPVETSETILSGQGEMQLDVTVKKLASKFGVESVLVDPKIPYRETIRKSIDAEGRHKKQTGGHGQFGHCKILFEPIYDSDTDFEFVDNVVGGVVPRAFIPAVEKGLRENIVKGVIAGYPLVHIRATLHDGSYHPVDSSEMAFKTAARLALKKCVDADPVLLEPIYSLDITVPDEYMGDIIGDMNRRRGRILGMNPVEDGQEVVVEVPLSEIFKYATDLRAMTQGRGSFKKTFVRYEEVPANVAQKIIAAANLPDDDE